MSTAENEVAGMTCRHCEMSVREEVANVPGGGRPGQRAERKAVVTSTEPVDDDAVRATVDVAGCQAVRAR